MVNPPKILNSPYLEVSNVVAVSQTTLNEEIRLGDEPSIYKLKRPDGNNYLTIILHDFDLTW